MSPSPCSRHLAARAFSMVELLVVVAIIGMLASLLVGGYSKVTKRAKEAKCISNLRQVSAGLMLYVSENNGSYPRATIKKGDPDNPSYDPNDSSKGADYMWSKALGPYLPQRTDSVTAAQNKVFVCPAANYPGYANAEISTTYASTATLFYFSSPTVTGSATQGPARLAASVEKPSRTILVAEGKLAVGATSPACSSSTSWTQASTDLGKSTINDTIYLDYRHSDRMNVLYADGHVGSLFFKDRGDITSPNWEGRNYTN